MIDARRALRVLMNDNTLIEVERGMPVRVGFLASLDSGVNHGHMTTFRAGFLGYMADGTPKTPHRPEYVWGIAEMTADQEKEDVWLSGAEVFPSGNGACGSLECLFEHCQHMPEPLAKAAVEWFIGSDEELRRALICRLNLPDDELAEFILKMFG